MVARKADSGRILIGLNRLAGRISRGVLMDKTKLGTGSYLLPMPVVLVGANVNDRPNFLTIAYVGIVGHTPAMIEIALRKNRFSSAGIKKNLMPALLKRFLLSAISIMAGVWLTMPT